MSSHYVPHVRPAPGLLPRDVRHPPGSLPVGPVCPLLAVQLPMVAPADFGWRQLL